MPYKVTIVDDIDTLERHAWNTVAGDTLHRGYRWQQYKQQSMRRDWLGGWTAFITVERAAQLVGVATAYRYAIPFGFKSHALRHLSRAALWPLNPINFLVPPTVLPGEDRQAVLRSLVSGVKQLERRSASLGTRHTFLEREKDAALIALYGQSGFSVTPGIWQTDLPLPWRSFAEYVASLQSRVRVQLRRQLSVAEDAGITITTDNPDAVEGSRVYQLLANVAQRNRSLLLYNKRFIEIAQHVLGPKHFTLLRAVHQQQTVACLKIFHDGTTAQLAAIGLDETVSRKFNLYRVLIYRAIEWCLEQRYQLVVGGMSNYAIKKRFGFTSRPTLTATHSRFPLLSKLYAYTPSALRDD